MELTNEFVIDRPISETWTVLNDLEFIAPCMPGARLTEIEGEEYRGHVDIKVGPVSASYQGKARFVEQDEPNGRVVLKAEGRDRRQGNANALVTATLSAVSESETLVMVHTDLSLSGKIASFGHGVIADVSAKILGQFSENLKEKLAVEPVVVASELPTPALDDGPDIRQISSPAPKPLDILSLGTDSVNLAQKVIPLVGALLGLLLLRVLLRGRFSR